MKTLSLDVIEVRTILKKLEYTFKKKGSLVIDKLQEFVDDNDPVFYNRDLSKEFDKIKSYDSPKIKKDGYVNEYEVFTIEVNDNTFMYFVKSHRDADIKQLKILLKK